MPKVAFVNTWNGGAVHNIFKPICDALNKEDGWEADWITVRGLESGAESTPRFHEYDVVHVNYFINLHNLHLMLPLGGRGVTFTATVNHIVPAAFAEAVISPSDSLLLKLLREECAAIHVTDPFCTRQLGQLDVFNVTHIPQVFDWSNFPLMELPPTFTVGYLGCDYHVKRFDKIIEACELAGVQHRGIARATLNEEQIFQPQDEITEFYRNISCYVVASFNDGGPLPPQEALLCGRPVATTVVGMMPLIAQRLMLHLGLLWQAPCYSDIVTFHDGSVKDMARAIRSICFQVEGLHNAIAVCRESMLPTVKDVVPMWKGFFLEAIG